MMKRSGLFKDYRGVSAVEFALVTPVLLAFLFGFYHTGVLLWANAGLKSAIGEASRMATLYPTPTDAQISLKVTSKAFGVSGGTLGTPVIARGKSGSQDYVNISVTYDYTIDPFLLPPIPVQLAETRLVYLQS